MRLLLGYHRLGLIVALLLLAGCPDAQDSSEEVSVLVVLEGQVSGISNERADLSAQPFAIVFTDRPKHKVTHIQAEGFVDAAWGEGGFFLADPPNASLVGASGTVAIVEIKTASWSDGNLVMDIDLLEGVLPPSGDWIAITVDSAACCNTLQCYDPAICS